MKDLDVSLELCFPVDERKVFGKFALAVGARLCVSSSFRDVFGQGNYPHEEAYLRIAYMRE